MRISKNEPKTRAAVEKYRKENDMGYIGDQMRAAYLKSKGKTMEREKEKEESREEYATDRVTDAMEEVSRDSVRYGRSTVKHIKQHHEKQTYRASDGSLPFYGSSATKTVDRSLKTVEQASVSGMQAPEEAIRRLQIQKAAKQAAKASDAASYSVQMATGRIKEFLLANIRSVKRVISSATQTTTALMAGGWIAMLVVVVVLMVGLIAGSSFGIFFTGEEFDGYVMKDVIKEINDNYQAELDSLERAHPDHTIEMSGSRAKWPEVLAIYAVKVTTDHDNGQEVATINDEKKTMLEGIFRQMNTITFSPETRTELEFMETSDAYGNIIETWVEVEKEYLNITVEHKSAEEMGVQLGFSEKQMDEVRQLIDEEHGSLWANVLYGIDAGDDAIVQVAASQIGNVGGQPYWSWYGFTSRVEWCACFVSWCANELGYIDAGVIPCFAGCEHGVYWFKQRDQWLSGREEPTPGMIIFFDWASNGMTGAADHVGIVARIENGRVYTIEGNTSDSCLERSYPLGHYEILGYGVPAY